MTALEHSHGMIAIGRLIGHENHHLRMVAVRHAWACWYQKRGEHLNAAVQFHAARERLEEMRNYPSVQDSSYG